ncbi:MAG: sulfite reductase [Verrucomicrobiota bacterium]|nr:sulfite reductase [Verrucomicrobiota bacterium]
MEKYSRAKPYHTKLLERVRLTGAQSTKKTFHLVLAVDAAEFPYSVGDSIGILIQNDPEEVKKILALLKRQGEEEIYDSRNQEKTSLEQYLLTRANLARVSPAFFRSLHPQEMDKTEERALLQNQTLLELCHQFSPPPCADVTQLLPLLPRLYSIANSPRFFPGEIHLTISYLSYMIDGKERRGTASHFLCELAKPHTTTLPIYLQANPSFHLPENPNSPIILVGPGTGVAPFRGFLQERIATRAEGRNWLFFGERHRTTDFYYNDFFLQLEKEGRLRLDLAFSRDGKEKLYVQHLMKKEAKSLWQWIEEGAYFYVCGDAEEMARDVERTLQLVAQENGGLSEEESKRYVKQMRLDKRYRADVY